MIYAKCIHKEQIITKEDEFERRNGVEENAVYCVGQKTVSTKGELSSVPLNYIFCCLKYGDKIAIVDSSNEYEYLQGEKYPTSSSYTNYIVGVNQQTIINIFDITPETVEYVFKQVGNPDVFPQTGYITDLDCVSFEVCKKYYELKNEPVPDCVLNKLNG